MQAASRTTVLGSRQSAALIWRKLMDLASIFLHHILEFRAKFEEARRADFAAGRIEASGIPISAAATEYGNTMTMIGVLGECSAGQQPLMRYRIQTGPEAFPRWWTQNFIAKAEMLERYMERGVDRVPMRVRHRGEPIATQFPSFRYARKVSQGRSKMLAKTCLERCLIDAAAREPETPLNKLSAVVMTPFRKSSNGHLIMRR